MLEILVGCSFREKLKLTYMIKRLCSVTKDIREKT